MAGKERLVEPLASTLRRQILTDANKAYLRRMPFFSTDVATPTSMDRLLRDLDRAEKRPTKLRNS